MGVLLIRETFTSVYSLKTRPVPNAAISRHAAISRQRLLAALLSFLGSDFLQRFLGMLEKSADDQVQFQGTTLEGCLDGVHKRAAATSTGSLEATKAEAIGLFLNALEDRFGDLLIDPKWR